MNQQGKEVPSEGTTLLAEFDEWWGSQNANGFSHACRFSAWNAWIAKDKQFRAELAQRAQEEPVAWMTNETPPRVASNWNREGMFAAAKESYCIPLYRQPITSHDRLEPETWRYKFRDRAALDAFLASEKVSSQPSRPRPAGAGGSRWQKSR